MTTYSPELKSKIMEQLLPPSNLSIKELSEKESIPVATLYTWRQRKISEGIAMPGAKSTSPDQWSAEQKLAIVVESYSMNAEELNEYCRKKGLYSSQIKSWQKACLTGYAAASKNKKQETDRAKQSKKRIRALEKELHRKEKALAEAAALLTLGKKFDALWAENEEN